MVSLFPLLLMATTTIEPSAFLKAPTLTLLGEPEVLIRTASGRIKRENMAKAQRVPDACTVDPFNVTRPAALLFDCAPKSLGQRAVAIMATREKGIVAMGANLARR